jgi:UDP-N-acetylmuramate--L-alanine ligase/UDP-N-acetylenolpyruvoylglucosamine reductase
MQSQVKELIRELLKGRQTAVYLIGVAGSGMSGLARLLMAHGHKVSGSDLVQTAEVEELEKKGLRFFKGHQPEQMNQAKLVVYSSAIGADNPERAQAVKHGVLCVRRAECLAVLAEEKESVLVAGMHGKTTTSSMLAHTLRHAEKKPSHYVGAEVPILGASAAWDSGKHFVIEGDESDGTIELYHPHGLILLNIEEEHLDFYSGIEQITETFEKLVVQTKGPVVYCADNPQVSRLCATRKKAIGYGFSEEADYRIENCEEAAEKSEFTLTHKGKKAVKIKLRIPGRQNVSNAAGVAVMAHELGVGWEKIADALETFRGAKRRFEIKYRSKNFLVVDDYAHHPTEIRATLAAAKTFPHQRLVVLFQPHRFTRTQHLLTEFGSAFGAADTLYLTDIYAASEQPIEGITGESLLEAVKASGHGHVNYAADLKRLRSLVSRELQPGDLVVTMGAGDIHKVGTQLAGELENFEQLRALVKPQSMVLRQEPMSKHTSMRVGGPADLWFEPADEEDLRKGVRWARQNDVPVTLIGRGTNLLVREGGIRGLCIHLGQPYFSRIEVQGERVEAGAGARLKNIVAEAKKNGLGGFEFMEGIPGNLGGALRMNAGAMAGWTMEVVEEVRSMDYEGNIRSIPKQDLEIHYRSVPHFQNHIALSATLRGQSASEEEINKRLMAYSEKRWASQPAAPSAGCIFKNPGPSPAGKLIDELGLKNRCVGKARVSDIHGNFIVNDGGASADEILALIDIVKREAREKRDIELHTEVMILGEPL